MSERIGLLTVLKAFRDFGERLPDGTIILNSQHKTEIWKDCNKQVAKSNWTYLCAWADVLPTYFERVNVKLPSEFRCMAPDHAPVNPGQFELWEKQDCIAAGHCKPSRFITATCLKLKNFHSLLNEGINPYSHIKKYISNTTEFCTLLSLTTRREAASPGKYQKVQQKEPLHAVALLFLFLLATMANANPAQAAIYLNNNTCVGFIAINQTTNLTYSEQVCANVTMQNITTVIVQNITVQNITTIVIQNITVQNVTQNLTNTVLQNITTYVNLTHGEFNFTPDVNGTFLELDDRNLTIRVSPLSPEMCSPAYAVMVPVKFAVKYTEDKVFVVRAFDERGMNEQTFAFDRPTETTLTYQMNCSKEVEKDVLTRYNLGICDALIKQVNSSAGQDAISLALKESINSKDQYVTCQKENNQNAMYWTSALRNQEVNCETRKSVLQELASNTTVELSSCKQNAGRLQGNQDLAVVGIFTMIGIVSVGAYIKKRRSS